MKSSEPGAADVALADGPRRAVDEKERRANVVLAPDASSLSLARHFASSTLELWDYEDSDDIVPLLTSEIVSNAVRHAAGDVGLELVLVDGATLRVHASDESPDSPVNRRASPDGIGGHGLTIVESLASRWGVERHEGFKVVWYETPVAPRARATPRAL